MPKQNIAGMKQNTADNRDEANMMAQLHLGSGISYQDDLAQHMGQVGKEAIHIQQRQMRDVADQMEQEYEAKDFSHQVHQAAKKAQIKVIRDYFKK